MNIGFGAPVYVSKTNFTRFFVHFHRPADNSWIAAFEFDLESETVQSVYLDDPSLWRAPPNIDVPDSGTVPEQNVQPN
jgi:hypothetical protein